MPYPIRKPSEICNDIPSLLGDPEICNPIPSLLGDPEICNPNPSLLGTSEGEISELMFIIVNVYWKWLFVLVWDK